MKQHTVIPANAGIHCPVLRQVAPAGPGFRRVDTQ
jgi:hypothetical protein